MTNETHSAEGVLSELPGDLMIWVLIASELLVFGAALIAFLFVRAGNPDQFAADQALLNQTAGALNTLLLVTSGLFAALALHAREQGNRLKARHLLIWAGAGGAGFLAVKCYEYATKAADGIGIESSPFFTFYYLITGFHALHVVAGILVLALVRSAQSVRSVQTGVAFWHMVDLIWVLLFPIIYLLR